MTLSQIRMWGSEFYGDICPHRVVILTTHHSLNTDWVKILNHPTLTLQSFEDDDST